MAAQTLFDAIGARLRAVRSIKYGGRGQQACARALGIAQSTLSEYEGGKRLPSYELVRRLCELAGCSTPNVVSGYGDIRGPDVPEAADAIAQAVEAYGPEERVDVIKGAAVDVLLTRLESEQDRNRELSEENGRLRSRVKTLEHQLQEADCRCRDCKDSPNRKR